MSQPNNDAQIAAMLSHLFNVEGGFTDRESDRAHYGSAANPKDGKKHKYDCYCTNKGITQETLSQYYQRQATIDEVRNLTTELATEIYLEVYYRQPHIDQLPIPLQSFIFDFTVHSGADDSIPTLQAVLSDFGQQVKVDGSNGPKTQTAAAAVLATVGAKALLDRLCDVRWEFLETIIRDRPADAVNRNGWKKRVDSFRITA